MAKGYFKKRSLVAVLLMVSLLSGCSDDSASKDVPVGNAPSTDVSSSEVATSTTLYTITTAPMETTTVPPVTTRDNMVQITSDPALTASGEHSVVVDEEFILDEDDTETTEAPVETTPDTTTTTIYAEDVDHAGPIVEMPVYENTSDSTYRGPIDKTYKWDELEAQNSDIMGWLYVPNTNINYPILQEQVFGEYYYATHDVYHNEIISGGIFTPNTAGDTDAHFLILGHNMRNDTMFGTLDYYKTESFCSSNPYIYIYYPDRTEKWQVWTAYQTLMDDLVYDMPYQLGSTEYEALISSMDSKKWYTSAAQKPTINDRTLTLSTCDNFDGEHEGRFIVNAVLVETKNLTESAAPAVTTVAPTNLVTTTESVVAPYILNTDAHVIHKSDCVYINNIKPEYKVDFSGNVVDKCSEGYELCGECF